MISVQPVSGGFEYRIGELIIARSRWKRKSEKWQLQLIHMTVKKDQNFGVLAMDYGPLVPNPKAALDYLYKMLGAVHENVETY